MITFVTGIFNSGKTTYAKEFAKQTGAKYMGFDSLWGYTGVSPRKAEVVLGKIADDPAEHVVVDAIPYDGQDNGYGKLATFRRWMAADNRAARIMCMVIDKDEWKKRCAADGTDTRMNLDREWSDFHLRYLPSIEHPMKFHSQHEPAKKQRALEIVEFHAELLKRVSDKQIGYDSTYQDIPEIAFRGYSGSAASWDRIRDLVAWRGKFVVDLGCFHGFMLFRAEDSMAYGIGLDECEPALETARAIALSREGIVGFKRWTAGEDIPRSDVTLCLNALHHFKDHRFAVYEKIQSPVTIFEVDEKFEHELRSHWTTVEKHASARPQRAIYRCQR
jgi:hypothetical protein